MALIILYDEGSGDRDTLDLAYDLISKELQLNQGTGINEISTDGTLSENSDNKISTQKAIKAYVDSKSGSQAIRKPADQIYDRVGIYTADNDLLFNAEAGATYLCKLELSLFNTDPVIDEFLEFYFEARASFDMYGWGMHAPGQGLSTTFIIPKSDLSIVQSASIIADQAGMLNLYFTVHNPDMVAGMVTLRCAVTNGALGIAIQKESRLFINKV